MAEISQAYTEGPLSVPDGLVLCWANDQDYGPYALTPTARSTFAEGVLPPNINLGESGPVELTCLDIISDYPLSTSPTLVSNIPQNVLDLKNIESDTPTVSKPTLGTGNLEIIFTGDSHNAHPTLSNVVDPESSIPTVNIHVRVIYASWRQFVFRITPAIGKRPLFNIVNPSSNVAAFDTKWRPWYSYDGLTWTRFDTAPVNNTTTWTFQNSTSFTENVVYVSYQPAWPLSYSQNLIDDIITNAPSLIHELPSTTNYAFPTLLNNQTDELGNTVPGQKMYGFGIWDNTLSPTDGSQKRIAIISGGMHAGEHVGSWSMEGFVRTLTESSALATSLLQKYKFYIYPCVNPMGRYMGHYRGQRDPAGYSIDPNRDYPIDGSAPALQSSQIIKEMMITDIGTNKAAFYLDFHATWGSPSTAYFYYPSTSPYVLEWDSRIKTYAPTYDDKVSTVETGLGDLVDQLFGPYHNYTPETYETAAFLNTDAIKLVGVNFAKALDDSPLSEMRLPIESNIYNIIQDAGCYISLDYIFAQDIIEKISTLWVENQDTNALIRQTYTSNQDSREKISYQTVGVYDSNNKISQSSGLIQDLQLKMSASYTYSQDLNEKISSLIQEVQDSESKAMFVYLLNQDSQINVSSNETYNVYLDTEAIIKTNINISEDILCSTSSDINSINDCKIKVLTGVELTQDLIYNIRTILNSTFDGSYKIFNVINKTVDLNSGISTPYIVELDNNSIIPEYDIDNMIVIALFSKGSTKLQLESNGTIVISLTSK